MGIDDESSHPKLCSEVADGVTRNIVCLFREPDAGNPPVRFDEREQETESSPTGLRRRRESFVSSHRETKAPASVLDSTQNPTLPLKACNRLIYKSRSQGHFSPSTGRRRYFLAFQPLVRETRRWVVPRILHSSISVPSLLSSDDIDRFLELASRGGCLVGNTWIYLRLVA